MHTLIAFATHWGTKHGGINSFNADFLTAFGSAYSASAQVVCVVASAAPEDIERAAKAGVTLIPLPFVPKDAVLDEGHADAAIDALKKRIGFDCCCQKGRRALGRDPPHELRGLRIVCGKLSQGPC